MSLFVAWVNHPFHRLTGQMDVNMAMQINSFQVSICCMGKGVQQGCMAVRVAI